VRLTVTSLRSTGTGAHGHHGWYLSENRHDGKQAKYDIALLDPVGGELTVVRVTVGRGVKFGEANFAMSKGSEVRKVRAATAYTRSGRSGVPAGSPGRAGIWYLPRSSPAHHTTSRSRRDCIEHPGSSVRLP
jgi:hypothetical protein